MERNDGFMSIKVAINGFGRIGRNVFRIIQEREGEGRGNSNFNSHVEKRGRGKGNLNFNSGVRPEEWKGEF